MTGDRRAAAKGCESKETNDLFLTCSLIDYIGRETKNTRSDVVRFLGKERLAKICELADVYRSDNIDRVCDDFTVEAGIPAGDFENVSDCLYMAPSHWDIGKVYRCLIEAVATHDGTEPIDAFMDVYTSPISSKIDDYNSSFYYENPSYIFESYLLGAPL